MHTAKITNHFADLYFKRMGDLDAPELRCSIDENIARGKVIMFVVNDYPPSL